MGKCNFLFALLVCFTSLTVVRGESQANNYLNQAIWSQALNNFEINTPIIIATPWVFFYSNISSIDNDVLFKNNLDEDKVFSTRSLVLKELYSTSNNDFFKKMPADSIMIVRAQFKDRLLYTLSLNKSDSTTTIDYLLPSNNTGENVVYGFKGNMVSNRRFNPDNTITSTCEWKGDSLCITTTNNEAKSYYTVEEGKYKDGVVLSKSIYRENKQTLKRTFVSNKKYIYDNPNQLSEILITNKKGRPIDSVEYHYTDNQLYSIIQNHTDGSADMIFYQYENGQISEKSIRSFPFELQINKKYKEHKLDLFSIKNESDNSIEQYQLEYNIQDQLSSMLYKSGSLTDDINTCFKAQYIFSYNDCKNIKSIKIVDNHGVVRKEIYFEYEFRKK
ncbi:MAG TPA: hypothetical protein VK152_05050 [Paludibacter sp.]|nr:hypothetical protein [Paludibacter sp.]